MAIPWSLPKVAQEVQRLIVLSQPVDTQFSYLHIPCTIQYVFFPPTQTQTDFEFMLPPFPQKSSHMLSFLLLFQYLGKLTPEDTENKAFDLFYCNCSHPSCLPWTLKHTHPVFKMLLAQGMLLMNERTILLAGGVSSFSEALLSLPRALWLWNESALTPNPQTQSSINAEILKRKLIIDF